MPRGEEGRGNLEVNTDKGRPEEKKRQRGINPERVSERTRMRKRVAQR